MLLRRWKQSFWEVVYIYREEGRQCPHLYLVVNPCGPVNPQSYIVYIYTPYKGCPYSLDIEVEEISLKPVQLTSRP